MKNTEENNNGKRGAIFTIPNLMSLFRILLIPVIIWLYRFRQEYGWAVAVLLLSGTTDLLDGWVARRFNMVSDLGKAIDPIADKLTQGAVIFCLIHRYPVMAVLFGVLIVKETIMGVTNLILIKRTQKVSGAVWHGKVTTCLLDLTMVIHFIWVDLPKALSMGLAIACMVLMAVSMVLYLVSLIGQIRDAAVQGE